MDGESTSHEVATLLHLLKHYDRARAVFGRYSARRKGDREVLSIKMQPRGCVTGDLVLGIARSFPFRIRGPFLVDGGTLEIEVLDTPALSDGSAHGFAAAALRKRKSASCLDATRDAVLRILEEHHDRDAATRLVTATRDGADAHGAWLEFDFAPAARVDLAFMLACLVSDDTEAVKSIALEARTPAVLLVRLYRDDEHRIISTWDVVPATMPRTGTLLGVRHRVSFADSLGL